MSILIKGEKMPDSCGHCWLIDSGTDVNGKPEYECVLTEEKRAREDLFSKRGKYCPLVEIPPHGRLIDADRLEYNGLRCYTPEVYEPPRDDTELVISKYEIDEETPTVIEAEGVSDNECSD